MTKLPAPRGVIFDWDNTLVNTWPVIRDALNATFREWNMPEWSMNEVRERVRKSMRDSFPGLFGDQWEKAGQHYQHHYKSSHLKALEALPQAEEVLKRVKELGLFSVVVSNKKGGTLRDEVKHMGWAKLFDTIVGSDDAARDKPHHDPVHLAFEKSHIKPGADIWFLGDSDIDLECALNCGCTAILYGESAREHPDYTATHFQGFPYHAHAHNHAETLRLLKNIEFS